MKPTQNTLVPLTRGAFALVDPGDLETLLAYGSWCVKPHGRTAYAMRSELDTETGKWRTLYMHHAITGWRYVDHRNGNGLDNRRANLREATHYGNTQNARRKSSNTSGYIGVYWRKDSHVWAAAISANGQRHHLGCFTDAEEAALARDAAARELHGEFARLNFPAA